VLRYWGGRARVEGILLALGRGGIWGGVMGLIGEMGMGGEGEGRGSWRIGEVGAEV